MTPSIIKNSMRRNFLKILGFSLISALVMPVNFLYAATKKLLNKNLSEEQKNVMFNEGTEKPFSSELNKEKRDGSYHCANCGIKLFESQNKYESGSGWPSFFQSLPEVFDTKTDHLLGYARTEYHCKNCNAHHGHIFDDGPQPTGKRYCNNGVCLIFEPKKK